jgi:hypothetical protein
MVKTTREMVQDAMDDQSLLSASPCCGRDPVRQMFSLLSGSVLIIDRLDC